MTEAASCVRLVTLTLPFPPSSNRYWKHSGRGGHAVTYLSKEALTHRKEVGDCVLAAGIREPLTGRLAVEYRCFMPYPVKGDLGNVEKCASDSLTHAGVWVDDAQLWSIHLERFYDKGHARVEVKVMELR